MVRESGRRPWADLDPELLNLIYQKLTPTSAAARSSGFGSVCKPWRRFHAAVPLPPPDHHPHLLISPTVVDAAIPDEIRHELQAAAVVYSWPSSGWLLLRNSRSGQIFSCFNPLFLPWPQNYIELPSSRSANPVRDPHSPPPPPRIIAAFSSDPAGPDECTLLVIGEEERHFRTFRRGDSSWKNYYIYYGMSDSREIIDCVAIGFSDGKFFCMFERRYLLIFGIGGGGERRVLEAVFPPPPPGNDLQMLERGWRGDGDGGSCVVVSWERIGDIHGGGGGGGGRRWRLARVEEEVAEGTAAELMMEEGRRRDSRVVVFRENPQCKIWRIWKHQLLTICIWLCLYGVGLIFVLFVSVIPAVAGARNATP